MNKDNVISFFGILLSLTITIITTIGSDFDFKVKIALVSLSTASAFIILISNIGLSLDLKYMKDLLQVTAYSAAPSHVIYDKLLPKISIYCTKLYGVRTMGSQIYSSQTGEILKLTFSDINK